MITSIDPTHDGTAERIVEIQRAAYAVEASLMRFDGIPQLTEAADEVRALSHLHWLGIHEDDQLVAVLAYEIDDGTIDIDRLAVDPSFARKGYGRRLVQAVPTDRPAIVSTGSANDPAIRLYLGEGFSTTGETEVVPGIFTTQFHRDAR